MRQCAGGERLEVVGTSGRLATGVCATASRGKTGESTGHFPKGTNLNTGRRHAVRGRGNTSQEATVGEVIAVLDIHCVASGHLPPIILLLRM